MSALVTRPVGSKVMDVRPGMMPLAASLLIAVTRSAPVMPKSAKPMSMASPRSMPALSAARVKNSAICERVTLLPGSNVSAVLPVVIP